MAYKLEMQRKIQSKYNAIYIKNAMMKLIILCATLKINKPLKLKK